MTEAGLTYECKQAALRAAVTSKEHITYRWTDGKRYRSNKEVCKKFLGINEFVSPPKKAKTAK